MSAPAPTPCGVDECEVERITAPHVGGGLCYQHWQAYRVLLSLRLVSDAAR